MARKRTFSSIFEPLIETVQMIYRWKDNEIAQLFHVLRFFKILTVFEQFWKYQNSDVLKKQADSNLDDLFQPYVGMMQMIWRWKATD